MTDRFTVGFEIDGESLAALTSADARIVVAKHGAASSGHVAWLAWTPSGRDTLVWRESYGLYAAEAAPRQGSPIVPAAVVDPALERTIYPFGEDGFRAHRPASHLPAQHYDVRNDTRSATTFGLLQWAAVNGTAVRSPLNAVVVPAGFTADFAALRTLSIWCAPGARSGSIARIPGTAAVVVFDEMRRTARLRYDARSAGFAVEDGASRGRPRPPILRSR
jgi:hypothetical protein